jgi:hypothetical protein
MAITALTLPVDIQWKRVAVSEDMIDPFACDRRFPFRWRSSLAVFTYEPPAEQQTYDGMIVSYVKVSSTITGFQIDHYDAKKVVPGTKEVGLLTRRLDSGWNDPRVIAAYRDNVQKYYGCYGAVLEVTVSPHVVDPTTHQALPKDGARYPYFLDVEPKKRELYETVTQTGETMSRTLSDVNVKKGSTTTQSHEKLDVMNGVSANTSAAAGVGGYSGSAALGGSATGQQGTIDINESSAENVRTSDAGREARETLSHTTQLQQMYQQFTAYHVGTNRALFFMLPRPHIVQTELTFVNGPRLLEGIQDVLLVVLRPADMKEVCIEAYLETAHIASEPIAEYERVSTAEYHHIETKPFQQDDQTKYGPVSQSLTYVPPAGWEIDYETNGGFQFDISGDGTIEAFPFAGIDPRFGSADFTQLLYTIHAQSAKDDQSTPAKGTVKLTVFLRRSLTSSTFAPLNDLFITGRGVCSCPVALPPPSGPKGLMGLDGSTLRPNHNESFLYEEPLRGLAKPVGATSGMGIADANRIRHEIGHAMIRSRGSATRASAGERSVLDANFLAHRMARYLGPGHPDDVRPKDLPGLPATVAKRLAEVAPHLRRAALLRMSLEEQADRFGLTSEQSIELRRAALGLSGEDRPPHERWKHPALPREALEPKVAPKAAQPRKDAPRRRKR